MQVYKINNTPIDSCCYIIATKLSKKCIIIDPGTEDNRELICFLREKKLTPIYVILTHEHFDHCMGVNHLNGMFDFELICSGEASKGIKNSKQNFSKYWEDINSFEIEMQPKVVSDNEVFEFKNLTLQFIKTPGHSPGSMCIQINNSVFTGDTLLNNTKVPLKLPGSNKEQYKISIEKLNRLFKCGMEVYPGHGDSFVFKGEQAIVKDMQFSIQNK